MPNAVKKEEQPKTEKDLKRKKTKWPWFVGGAAALCLIFALSGLRAGGREAHHLAEIDLVPVARRDLQDTVSATGTVESAESTMVYSTVGYTVQEVLVEVGDRVEEGQLLCKLDDQKIQNQIESQQASLKSAQSSSNAAIRSAQDAYDNFREGLDKGMNSSIINAENMVTSSYNAYVSAQNAYDRYAESLRKDENTAMIQQENALRAAENAADSAAQAHDDALDALDAADEVLYEQEKALEKAEGERRNAQRALRNAQDSLSQAEAREKELQQRRTELETQVPQTQDEEQLALLQAELQTVMQQLTEAESALNALLPEAEAAQQRLSQAELLLTQQEAAADKARAAYDAAEKQADRTGQSVQQTEDSLDAAGRQYSAALTNADNTLADYARSADTAREAYETAQTQLEAARAAAQNQLETYKNNLNSAYAGAGKDSLNVSLRQLRVDLESTEITAPAAGTVTAVYAEVGSPGSGLLFVIEDTDHFVVTTSVKDYDVVQVGTGTEAVIRSNATGDRDYRGTVTTVAPTANKTPAGVTDTAGDVSFAAEVRVDSEDTQLRIGMNVRLNFILAEEKNTLAAPYDAVYTGEAGQTFVLAAEPGEKASFTLREIPVTTGLETDLEIAVSGAGLEEGMIVLCNPEQYLPYLGETLTAAPAVRGPWEAK